MQCIKKGNSDSGTESLRIVESCRMEMDFCTGGDQDAMDGLNKVLTQRYELMFTGRLSIRPLERFSTAFWNDRKRYSLFSSKRGLPCTRCY